MALITASHFKCHPDEEQLAEIRCSTQNQKGPNLVMRSCSVTFRPVVNAIVMTGLLFKYIATNPHVCYPHANTHTHIHTHTHLSHKIGEKEHVAEESRPSQQMTDTQAAVVAWHVYDSFHQRPECHSPLGLQVHTNKTNVSSSNIDKNKQKRILKITELYSLTALFTL